MRKVKHTIRKSQRLITSLGVLELDENGYISNISLTDEQIDKLLNIPNFVVEEVKEPKEEVVVEVVEVDEPEEALDLHAMKVKELKALAEEKGIELEATKKADIIKELEAKL